MAPRTEELWIVVLIHAALWRLLDGSMKAIANGFGGLEAMHERIITEQAAVEAERKRKDGAKLRLIMRSELQEALTRFAQMYSRNPTKMPKEAELNRAGRFDLRWVK